MQDEAKRNALESLLTQGGIALIVVSAAAIAFGWLLAGRALQPCTRSPTRPAGLPARTPPAGSARADRADRPSRRGTQTRRHVRRDAGAVGPLLRRAAPLRGERLTRAAYPLALNRALVELAVTRTDASEETRRLGESLLAVNERHERLIDGLLTLADSENELTERMPVDLAEVCAYTTDQAGKQAPGVRVRRALTPAPTSGDPVLLERLTFNLVENALRHNLPADGWVEVRTGMVDGRPTLTVTNTGPVIPGYDVETMFQPFRRLSRERVTGARGSGWVVHRPRGRPGPWRHRRGAAPPGRWHGRHCHPSAGLTGGRAQRKNARRTAAVSASSTPP
ncbi:HAMP domain-containing sensor histidine kinase [Micromonospora sp. M12]